MGPFYVLYSNYHTSILVSVLCAASQLFVRLGKKHPHFYGETTWTVARNSPSMAWCLLDKWRVFVKQGGNTAPR
ncbi:hypothetical protein Dda3937_04367 [Dickeya dadantii 3937]|uniref:Uncharacterized protein n=1 Tax=Dickeya dadantii (strain 3937) TaxID=198628 RepID=E0SM77_DICD3|nr:hypothetical protein Dda3937_04367 [Dickeya dadantii 3937]